MPNAQDKYHAPMPLAELLRLVPLFRQLDEAQIALLADQTRRRRFRANEALFHEGDPGHTLYLILKGRVRIEKVTASGRVQHLAHRGPGECFGELAMIDGQPRSADVITASDCELLMVDRGAFLACLESAPRLAIGVMTVLAERLRESGEHLVGLRELDVRGRLALALLDLAATHGEAGPHGVCIATAVTHQDLADEIGATRESVSRALAALRRAKALSTEGRTLALTNIGLLRRLCAPMSKTSILSV